MFRTFGCVLGWREGSTEVAPKWRERKRKEIGLFDLFDGFMRAPEETEKVECVTRDKTSGLEVACAVADATWEK